MTRLLDDLVDKACSQLLSEGDLEELSQEARSQHQTEAVLRRLLLAGTAASRHNLLATQSLGHAAKRVDHNLLKQWRKKARQKRVRQIRTSNQPFSLTYHAIQRFFERHPQFQDLDLEVEARASVPMKGKTLSGDKQWAGPSGVVFVVRRDRDMSLVCVTILSEAQIGCSG